MLQNVTKFKRLERINLIWSWKCSLTLTTFNKYWYYDENLRAVSIFEVEAKVSQIKTGVFDIDSGWDAWKKIFLKPFWGFVRTLTVQSSKENIYCSHISCPKLVTLKVTKP